VKPRAGRPRRGPRRRKGCRRCGRRARPMVDVPDGEIGGLAHLQSAVRAGHAERRRSVARDPATASSGINSGINRNRVQAMLSISSGEVVGELPGLLGRRHRHTGVAKRLNRRQPSLRKEVERAGREHRDRAGWAIARMPSSDAYRYWILKRPFSSKGKVRVNLRAVKHARPRSRIGFSGPPSARGAKFRVTYPTASIAASDGETGSSLAVDASPPAIPQPPHKGHRACRA
jgi:hypothetical protein